MLRTLFYFLYPSNIPDKGLYAESQYDKSDSLRSTFVGRMRIGMQNVRLAKFKIFVSELFKFEN